MSGLLKKIRKWQRQRQLRKKRERRYEKLFDKLQGRELVLQNIQLHYIEEKAKREQIRLEVTKDKEKDYVV